MSNYIPQKCLCLCYESQGPGHPLRSLGFTSSSKSSFVYVPQLIIPSLPSESQTPLLQPIPQAVCTKSLWWKVFKWRWKGERCKDDPSRTSNPARVKKKKKKTYYSQVRYSVEIVQIKIYGNLEWEWGLNLPSPPCCDPSGVCLNVLTGDILKGSYHLWPELIKLRGRQYEQICSPELIWEWASCHDSWKA